MKIRVFRSKHATEIENQFDKWQQEQAVEITDIKTNVDDGAIVLFVFFK